MILCNCTYKQRDERGNIIMYMVEDNFGNTRQFYPQELKNMIRAGEIDVINLTLTSDNRLVDASDKKIPTAPIIEKELLVMARLKIHNDEAVGYIVQNMSGNIFMIGRREILPKEYGILLFSELRMVSNNIINLNIVDSGEEKHLLWANPDMPVFFITEKELVGEYKLTLRLPYRYSPTIRDYIEKYNIHNNQIYLEYIGNGNRLLESYWLKEDLVNSGGITAKNPKYLKYTEGLDERFPSKDGAEKIKKVREAKTPKEKRMEVRQLKGFMSDDNTQYNESIGYNGLLQVRKSSWDVHFQPRGYSRIGVWVTPGYTIPGKQIDKYGTIMLREWDKAQSLINKNPLGMFEYDVESIDLKMKYSPSARKLTMWLKFSQVYLESREDIQRFIRDIKSCSERVNEIRELQGWNTRGNWFGKIFG